MAHLTSFGTFRLSLLPLSGLFPEELLLLMALADVQHAGKRALARALTFNKKPGLPSKETTVWEDFNRAAEM